MSTSAVSGIPVSQQLQQYFQTRQKDLQQLGQELQSGDLAGAQSAFNKIASLGQNGPFASGSPFQVSQRTQDFAAVGQALQSGDLGAARTAFAALKGTFHNNAANGGPGGTLAQPSGGSTGPGPEIIVNLTQPSSGGPGGTLAQPGPSSTNNSGPEIVLNLNEGANSTGSPEQITININPSSNGGEQIALSVGNQGSTAQQVTFNLAANSNEQIVLNLLGASSTSGTSATTTSTTSANGGLSVTA